MDTFSAPVDASQVGARTRARFRYQDGVIAHAVMRLLNQGVLASALVEYGTDLTLVYTSGEVELVSIKSRDPHQQHNSVGWTWDALKKQDVLRHLYQLWVTQPGVKTTVYSEAPLQGDAARLTDPGTRTSPQMLTRVARQIEATEQQATEFLASFAWGPPTPRDPDLIATIEKHVREYLGEHGRDANAAPEASRALIAAIERASTGDPRVGPSDRPTRSHADDAPGLLERERTLTVAALQEILLTAADRAAKGSARLTSSPSFVGHASLIDDVLTHLQSGRTCALVGPPGAGKTSIAFEVAARADAAWRVHLIDASGPTELAMSLASMVGGAPGQSGPPEGIAAFPGDADDLLIVDGVTSPDVIAPYLRAAGTARVLITSTSSRLTASVSVFPVEGLSQEETREFLSKNWSDAVGLSNELHRETHGNALALSQAAGTARLARLSPDAYLQTLATSPEAALSLHGEHPSDHTVAKSITLALRVLQERSPEAHELLAVLCVLGNGPIDVERFAHNTVRVFLPGRDFLDRAFLRRQTSIPLLATLREPLGRASLAAALTAASHVRRVGDSVIVHPLVRRLVLATTADLTLALETAMGSFDLFDAESPGRGETFDELRLIDSVLTHCAERGAFGPAYYVAAKHASMLLSSIGARDRALAFAGQAHDWALRSVAAGHSAAESRFFADHTYAVALSSAGEHEPSAQLLLASLRDLELVLARLVRPRRFTHTPEADIRTAHALAHAKLEMVVHLVRIAVERGDTALAAAIHLPGAAEVAQWPGRTEQVMYWTARARWEWVFGDADAAAVAAKTAVTLVRDGSVAEGVATEALAVASGMFHNQDAHERARLASEVLGAYTRTFGEGSRDTIEYVVLLTECADADIDNEDIAAARRNVEEAARLQTESFPGDEFLRGRVLAARGRLALAEAIHGPRTTAHVFDALTRAGDDLGVAVAIAEKLPEKFATDHASILINYATTLGQLGHFAEAIAAAERAWELDRQRFGANHPEIAIDEQVIEGLRRQSRG